MPPYRSMTLKQKPVSGHLPLRGGTARPVWATLRRCAGLLLLALGLAQLDAADLAGQRLRQGVDELDLARIGECRQVPPHELLDLILEFARRLVPLAEHDERLHEVAALRVRRRDRGGLLHGRMLYACRLDLERPDPVPGGDDH